MIKLVLVDDEKSLLEELKYLLENNGNVEILDSFTNPVEALKKIPVLKPDAVFLDIDMPILNGLNLARELTDIDRTLLVVFITSYNNYAVQAFEINAIDYVLKPIRKDRLNNTIDKINSMMEKRFCNIGIMSEKIDCLEFNNKYDFQKIVAFDGEEYNVINAGDILYIEVNIKDTIIVTKQRTYITRKSLDLWEKRLRNLSFFRCHRSFLVNLNHIVKISPMFNNNYIIKQQDSSYEIPVSKSHIMELKKLLDK